jgi:glycosyltransferase involved in cell wall biosynthesis
MRLAYLLPSASFGMHQYTADLANRAAEIHDTFLCTTKQYPADRYSPRVKVVKPIVLGTTGFSTEGIQIKEAYKFQKSVSQLNPDIIHLTGPHLWNPYFIQVFRRKGIPVVHTIHDLDPHLGMKFGRLLPLWNKAIYRSTSHLVVHGNIYRDRLINTGFSEDRVTAIPLLHLFLSYEAQSEISNDKSKVSYGSFFLFFGRFERYKGIDILVKAFCEMKMSNNSPLLENFKLVLAGPGSLGHLGQTNHCEHIEVINRHVADEQATNLFKGCAAVILPYLDASQSAIIPSAYYYRKPVVATKTGAFEEYIESGVTGHLVESGDIAALKSALLKVAVDKKGQREMGKAGRHWYDTKRAQETSDLLSLYERLFKG